jgi:hypothetical protein
MNRRAVSPMVEAVLFDDPVQKAACLVEYALDKAVRLGRLEFDGPPNDQSRVAMGRLLASNEAARPSYGFWEEVASSMVPSIDANEEYIGWIANALMASFEEIE